jgi:regulatory protein
MTTAMERALKLLARKARTQVEVERALEKFSPAERDAAVARLKDLGYMDDREVGLSRARSLLAKGEAPRLAARRLASQGVSGKDARAAVAEAAGGAADDELVARALRLKLRGRKPKDEGERRRLFRSLVAKGHRASAVARALQLAWEGDDDALEE